MYQVPSTECYFAAFRHTSLFQCNYLIIFKSLVSYTFLTAFHPLLLLHFPPLLSTPHFPLLHFPLISVRTTFLASIPVIYITKHL